MEHDNADRRTAARYPIQAKVSVRKNGGETVITTACNISGAGMLLHIEGPSGITVDEEVTVEVESPNNSGKPFSAWGVGRIVRIDGCDFGVQLSAGTFHSTD